jgi:hypothetical protein
MVNVFSFCLYGAYNPRYYPGMTENIRLVLTYFPDWKVYVYIAPDVDADFVNTLRQYGNVVLRETGVTGSINMIHRFYAIDEPNVDLMMVRDADSRIHWKDRWAIRDFMAKSYYVAHTIRDNIVHNARMMGGLWGLRKSAGINVHQEYEAFCQNQKDDGMGHDQNFLSHGIYPKVLPRLLVHKCQDVARYLGEHCVVFPFEWTNDIYCGRIETAFIDRPQPNILPWLPKGTIKLSR